LLSRAHGDGVILLGPEKGRVKEMRVYEAVDMTLKALGLDTVFGVMGDGNMRFVTHMTQECGITYYAARHESAAVGMADAYARVTGKVGVSTITQGPGLTNTPTPVAEAAKARTPLLLLTGASPLGVRWHTQRVGEGSVRHQPRALASSCPDDGARRTS
jgi:thiamine pyrophosphate-dependent acetolactate synthase large subunit-like protein